MNFFVAKEVFSSSITVTPKGVTLPNRDAKFVKLSNWNVEDNEDFPIKTPNAGFAVEEAQQEVMWGFGATYAHQLFPSRETEIFSVTKLNDVCLRCRLGQEITIWYSFWN